jgi:hypothetical protein
MLIVPLRNGFTRFGTVSNPPVTGPFAAGVYDVRTWVRNGDTIPPLLTDSMRWKDVIFDTGSSGSIGTSDSLFWQRYRRGYFRFRADTEKQTAAVWKTSAAFDSTYLFEMRYEQPDSMTIRIWAAMRDDSVYAELVRSNRHFQLTERQFHWLSEYNR